MKSDPRITGDIEDAVLHLTSGGTHHVAACGAVWDGVEPFFRLALDPADDRIDCPDCVAAATDAGQEER